MFPQRTEQLINAIEILGVRQFSTIREAPERFSVMSLASTKGLSCTVTWLGHEPTFRADFNPGMVGLTFNISWADACLTAPRATHEFQSVDEAARWILENLRGMSTN